MKRNLLVVEDDHDFGSILKHYLELSDYDVTWCNHPQRALDLLEKEFNFDLAILDVMMPDINGYTLAQAIRKTKPTFPFLFLTAKNQQLDRIMGLKLGADDYIAKPCDPEELILRIENILKRNRHSPIIAEIIEIGNYQYNTNTLQLIGLKETHQLTEKEADLLHFLLKHNKSLVKREVILAALWNNTDYFSGRSMDVFISRLRKYFSTDDRISIRSIRGIGFHIDFPL